MAIHFQSICVDSFRGIKNLKVDSLNHINLIVGDNNSGKTSILESLLLLRAPGSFVNTIRVARQREAGVLVNRISTFDDFLALMPKSNNILQVRLEAQINQQPVSYQLQGKETKVLLDEQDIPAALSHQISLNQEAAAFLGELNWRIGTVSKTEEILFHEYSRVSGLEVSKKNYIDMVYLSPIDHVKSGLLTNIVRNPDYKDICIHIIQLFDPKIVDLLILKNEHTNRPVEYIRHSTLGNLPLSAYGDGIKKVLLLANAMIDASSGVLLIDEIDTAIHSKYFFNIFQFLISASTKLNVQLFITTHNIEAVDALLETQNYDEQKDLDLINVITLKRGDQRTYCRSLSGREVCKNRETFGFEVRL